MSNSGAVALGELDTRTEKVFHSADIYWGDTWVCGSGNPGAE